VRAAGTSGTFVVAGVLATIAALFVLFRYETSRGGGPATDHLEQGSGVALPATAVFWKTKTSCLGTFTYGYFQASVVLFLPLFLIESKSIPESRTILITAFFAGGMLVSSSIVSRLGDRHGHLLVMRILGAVGGLMVASFVLLDAFSGMCAAVFVAGATLASISPVSLALQGVIMPKRDLGRANALYNASYAAGMLLGPPISSLFFTRFGGGPMLVHLALLWACFVVFASVFANDDPHRAEKQLRSANAD
jgi:MFS family permease